jgi:malonyl-CoA decarboxylase
MVFFIRRWKPLVFVEVALTDQVPRGIGEILKRDPGSDAPENPSCAIFYSISTCHRGLAGVSFGNFLIKQVATSLKLRFPQLKTFATISPAPGFRRWIEAQAQAEESVAALIENFDADADDKLRDEIEKLAASYFLEQKNDRDQPLDPVARFHLKNGAILERINILGNPSDSGMERSLGTMVNYVYDLSRVEENHEEYVKNNRIITSSQVRKALSR